MAARSDNPVHGEPSPVAPVLDVDGLRVTLPDGRTLIDDMTLSVLPGEVAVLLGGSGAGKSTFSRVLFERDELMAQGFRIAARKLDFDRDDIGLVPQRGALFDHLDVAGNLDLAIRYARDTGDVADPADWLARVGMPPGLAKRGHKTSTLSGGQAQRVAVARVLASGRRLLFLDEPSVGLDPHRVRVLSQVIREQVDRYQLASIVVTHDVALAVGVADRLYLLDGRTRRLTTLFTEDGDAPWPGPMDRDGVAESERASWLVALEKRLSDDIRATVAANDQQKDLGKPASAVGRWFAARTRRFTQPFQVATYAILYLLPQLFGRLRDVFVVSRRVWMQALLRPLAFYGVVSLLIGYTILYVISKVGGAGVRPDALVRQIGGSHVIALAPALAAVLFVAASGSAVNAWLGSMALTKQTAALEALGVDRRRYLWTPVWWSLGISYLCVATTITLGMVAGGVIVCSQLGVDNGWELLTGDILDPRPERLRHVARAGLLLWVYGWGIASDIVAKADAPKSDADDVTRAMTRSVVATTLWMVGWELATVLLLF